MEHEEVIKYTCEVGYETVVIDKLFGPMIFANLKVRADAESGDWIIERQWIKNGNYIEWCRIPGQFNDEFSEELQ